MESKEMINDVAIEEIVDEVIEDDYSSRLEIFQRELQTLINVHSLENGSDTPDFILAEYLVRCLENFNQTTTDRGNWYK